MMITHCLLDATQSKKPVFPNNSGSELHFCDAKKLGKNLASGPSGWREEGDPMKPAYAIAVLKHDKARTTRLFVD